MTKPITDEAKIALEYPDKFYVGTFERTSRFEVHLDPTHTFRNTVGTASAEALHVRRRLSFANRARCRDTLFPDVGLSPFAVAGTVRALLG